MIEVERVKMHILAAVFGLNHPYTIQQSQYLDELLVKEQRRISRW